MFGRLDSHGMWLNGFTFKADGTWSTEKEVHKTQSKTDIKTEGLYQYSNFDKSWRQRKKVCEAISKSSANFIM